MAERLTPVDDVGAAFPWIRTGPPHAPAAPRPGFAFTGWQGNVVVSSWAHLWLHVIRRHQSESWPDFLHAAAAPCLVISQTPRRPDQPRMALYRLRPGLAHTFRVAIVQQHAAGKLVLVTAYPKQSLAGDHSRGLADRVRSTCAAYCLRRRDLQPRRGTVPVRWSAAAAVAGAGCCEIEPGC